MTQLTVNWNYPTAVKAGPGRIRELPRHCEELGMKRPLLVTDPGLAARPMVENAVSSCNQAGLGCGLFSNIKGNPTGANVEHGVDAFRQGQHDGVIAFGGGSGLDAAKAIALVAGQTRPLWDFEDIGENYLRADADAIAPILAVPTTAGTGSEVGRASVITDDASHTKRIIFHPRMLPGLVILDAELTVGLPARLTAATGMDALSHNLEALCSPIYHPMAAGIAAEGIRLVDQYLPLAVQDGADLQARQHMLVASCMGATAFQKGLGAMHALAHPLGALYDAHHGTLNAILMPYVLQANRQAIDEKMERVARYMNLPNASFQGFLDWVLAMRDKIHIPHTLRDIGIPDDRIDDIGAMAVADASASTNPIPFTPAQYTEILEKALDGKL